MTICAEIMTPNPKCHLPSASVELVAKTMRDNNIGPVLIVDGIESMRLIGIVTDRDIVTKVIAEDRDPRVTMVQEIMTDLPICCRPDDQIEQATRLMEECQVRRIPIVDNEKRLLGIIAQADIATRLNNPSETAQVVERISEAPPHEPPRVALGR